MTSAKKAAVVCVGIGVLAVGGELAYLHYERNKPMKAAKVEERGPTNPDYLVFLKQKRPSTPADVRQLTGDTLWVSAGGQMDYYPSNGRHADYGKPAGTLLGAEPIVVKGVFEQKAPKEATFCPWKAVPLNSRCDQGTMNQSSEPMRESTDVPATCVVLT